jgi:hypothetical protein
MKKPIYLSVICLSVLQSASAQGVAAQRTSLDQFIHDAGNKYDVYFTVEGACPSNILSNFPLAEEVSTKGVPGDINAVLSALTNSITNLTVMADAANKRIYHLVDKRLLGLDDSAMNRVLESIKFEGDAETFVNHIKETVPNLLSQSFSTGDLIIWNGGTAISINDVKASVRDALSNGVDLRGYNRLVWTGFTPLETHRTEVHFLGKTNLTEH